MPTDRKPLHRAHRSRLDAEQEMELWLGPSHRGSAFGSESERVAAWLKHRDRLMTAWAKHGKRPDGWWRYESPVPRPRFGTEQSTLYEMELLAPEERAELETRWREQFERAWDTNFFHCEGPGRFFHGAPARKRHYKWADIPASLLAEWSAARRRRGKIVRTLAEPASPAEPAV